MEVTPRQFRPALFQWRDVIHYEEPRPCVATTRSCDFLMNLMS